MKIAILGAGNMGSAIACGLVRSGKFQAEEIVCTARTETTLERLRTQCPGVRTTTDNAAAVRDAAVVMLAVKPWLTEALIREIRREIDPDRQSVVSVAAGVSLAQLAEWMTADSAVRPALFRVIPNTAIAVRQSMTFVAARVGIPLAVSARRSFIVPTATMTVHPVRHSGVILGVPQTMRSFEQMQQRITGFVAAHSGMTEKRYTDLMLHTGELVMDMGTVLDGRRAVKEKLIDELGGLSDALAWLYKEIERK